MYSKKLRSVSLLSFVGLAFCLLVLATVAVRNRGRQFEKIAVRISATTPKSKSELIAKFSDNSTNPCEGNLLDRQKHHYAREADGSYDNSRMISKSGSCQLMRFTFKQAVGCFDAIFERHFLNASGDSNLNLIGTNKLNKTLHFAFIGDSRMRQQFLNFLKLIPDYDRKSEPSPLPVFHHDDMEVTSDILRLRLSFQWRPVINDTVIDTIRQWTTDSQRDPPYLIFLGIAVWHMLQSEGANHHLYQKKLNELASILGQLANVSQVIWLNQYPTGEFYGGINDHNTDIHSEKIHHYNQAVRQILGNQKTVRIWDSSNPLTEEYVRACGFSQRKQLGPYKLIDPADSYVNCKDYTHAGYSALSQSTQLLFNDICNAFIVSHHIRAVTGFNR